MENMDNMNNMNNSEQSTPNDLVSKDERMWGMLCHLVSFAGVVIPFGHILGPLIVWMIKKDESPFIEKEGREALNFQISVTIYGVICMLLALILIGIFLGVALFIFWLVATIIAAVKANNGQHTRYPFTIRFL